jgi:RNA polymerase sigma-70 factor (ECF subfamily)
MTDRRLLARRFDAERPRLRAIAARLLGSAADADDAVQEAWLRLARADVSAIENLDAWLTTVVSRICLDQLRSARRTREQSWQVQEWRDEPVASDGDPAAEAQRAEDINVALLVVLDLLSPAERIAFVLHDVFGRTFEEIADVLDRSPAAARQLASRGRRRLRGAPASSDRRPSRRSREIVDAWLAAVQQGDLRALLGLLDDDAVLSADYGDRTETIEGARAIAESARLFGRAAASSRPVLTGGRPAVAAVVGGRVVSVMAFEIVDGRIVGLDVLADPAKLAASGAGEVLGLAWAR